VGCRDMMIFCGGHQVFCGDSTGSVTYAFCPDREREGNWVWIQLDYTTQFTTNFPPFTPYLSCRWGASCVYDRSADAVWMFGGLIYGNTAHTPPPTAAAAAGGGQRWRDGASRDRHGDGRYPTPMDPSHHTPHVPIVTADLYRFSTHQLTWEPISAPSSPHAHPHPHEQDEHSQCPAPISLSEAAGHVRSASRGEGVGPTPLHGSSLMVIRGGLLVYGGFNEANDVSRAIYWYSHSGQIWHQLHPGFFPCPVVKGLYESPCAVIFEGRLLSYQNVPNEHGDRRDGHVASRPSVYALPLDWDFVSGLRPRLRARAIDLLDDEETHDVAFRVEGKVIKAHKPILRRFSPLLGEKCDASPADGDPIALDLSPVLRAARGKDDTDAPKNGYDVFRLVLTHMYEGFERVPSPAESESLLYAAHHLDIPLLEAQCQTSVPLHDNNVLELFRIASEWHLDKLQIRCKTYVFNHMDIVLQLVPPGRDVAASPPALYTQDGAPHAAPATHPQLHPPPHQAPPIMQFRPGPLPPPYPFPPVPSYDAAGNLVWPWPHPPMYPMPFPGAIRPQVRPQQQGEIGAGAEGPMPSPVPVPWPYWPGPARPPFLPMPPPPGAGPPQGAGQRPAMPPQASDGGGMAQWQSSVGDG